MGLFRWIDTSSLLSILCEEAEDSAVRAGDAMPGDCLGSIPEMSRIRGEDKKVRRGDCADQKKLNRKFSSELRNQLANEVFGYNVVHYPISLQCICNT